MSPYVDNIMLHADPFHSYCVALVVAAPQAIENWAHSKGITFSDFEELCQKEETVKEVHASLVKVCITINETQYIFFMFRNRKYEQIVSSFDLSFDSGRETSTFGEIWDSGEDQIAVSAMDTGVGPRHGSAQAQKRGH